MSNEFYPELTLSEPHQAMLKASAISPDVAKARGYRTITAKAELRRMGYKGVQQNAPTLLIPIYGVCDRDKPSFHHHRPDVPRMREGKQVKYEFPGGMAMVIDVHPRIREKVRDPGIPLIITEGVKKADAAISADLCCIALLGVWNWRGTNEHGGKTTLPDLDEIAWKNTENKPRRVIVCFDSDAMTKPSVYKAMERFSAVLKARGADVSFINLPHGPDGVKWGLDDYLAAGHSRDELLHLVSADLLPLPVEAKEEAPESPYQATARGIVWMKPTPEGAVEIPLTTFTARIIKDVVTDDGAEQKRVYRIEGRCKDRCQTFEITIDAFERLAWPAEYLGASAYVYPGIAAKDHSRVAIRQLSGDVPEERIYHHLGWRLIEDEWAFLHAGGVIGGQQGVKVCLNGVASRYILPEPPAGEDLQEALQAVPRLLEIAPDRVIFPLLAGVFWATLGAADFSLFLHGKTGAFKSELAALAQRFFGKGMDAKNLPASWMSTDNALEELAFTAKDALLVIDDFIPVGSSADIQRLNAKADRVLRAQGNGSGRQRMRRDGSLQPERPPRGLILSTGEDIPQGQSLQARMFLIEVSPGDILKEKLTICQADAGRGRYSACMAAFLADIAPRYGELKAKLPAEVERVRNAANTDGHRRTSGIVAELYLGLGYFLTFAVRSGVLSKEDEAELEDRAWKALLQVGNEQSGYNRSSEPPNRFLELLRDAISSGQAHMAASSGAQPVQPNAWGWRHKCIGAGENMREEWQPQGTRIGYVQGPDIYLLPDAAYQIVRRLGDSVDGVRVTSGILWKRMKEAGLLASTDDTRETLKVRRSLENRMQNVLHLFASSLSYAETDIPDILDNYAEEEDEMR